MPAGAAVAHDSTNVRSALAQVARLDLGSYRPEHVDERVRRAIARLGVSDEPALVRCLQRDAEARKAFRRSILISHSGPFRDPEQFALLESELLPPLLERPGPLRVWSAGCANGLELYGVGALLQQLGALERSLLLGSDLLEENVAAAREAWYANATVRPEVRARARWELRDLVADGPPAGTFELVLCRNVAIYLTREAQARLHRTLAASLARHGVLLLGRSERLRSPVALGLEPAGPHAYRRVA